MSLTSRLTKLALLSAAGAAAYEMLIRPWHVRWGATPAEANSPLPGDDIVPSPKLESTRAVTVRAAAVDIWPWLVQMGQDRGGFYSYDWLERLFGLGIYNADRIIPAYQQLQVGDRMKIAPQQSFAVMAMQPAQALVLGQRLDTQSGRPLAAGEPIPDNFLLVSWAFALRERSPAETRLIVRFRLDYSPGLLGFWLWRVITEPGHFVMERKTLLGLKQRAEANRPSSL